MIRLIRKGEVLMSKRRDLDAAWDALIEAAAQAEQEFLESKKLAWVAANEAGVELAKEKEDWVNAETAGKRAAKTILADQLRKAKAGYEALDKDLNFIQSAMAGYRMDMEFARYGPQRTP
jgi:hypothetical protein